MATNSPAQKAGEAQYGRLLTNIAAVRSQARSGEATTTALCSLLKQWSMIEAKYAASLRKLGASTTLVLDKLGGGGNGGTPTGGAEGSTEGGSVEGGGAEGEAAGQTRAPKAASINIAARTSLRVTRASSASVSESFSPCARRETRASRSSIAVRCISSRGGCSHSLTVGPIPAAIWYICRVNKVR